MDQLDDLLLPVEAILQRCETRYLQMLYNISQFNSVQEFLGLLAKATGKLKKGGVPDMDAAARTLLGDWNGGKIKYYTHPPESEATKEEEDGSSTKVLSSFSEEFSLDSLEEMMETDKDQLPDVPLSATSKPKKEEEAKVSVAPSKGKKGADNDMAAKARPQVMSLKRSQKASQKKDRKKRNRQERLGQQLSEMMNSSM